MVDIITGLLVFGFILLAVLIEGAILLIALRIIDMIFKTHFVRKLCVWYKQ